MLSCLSHTRSFPPLQHWSFHGCFYSEEAQNQRVTCTYSQNLGTPGPDWSCVPWIVPFNTGSSSPASIHPSQVLLRPLSVPGDFSVPQQYWKGIAMEKDHQDLTQCVPPASPGTWDTAAIGQDAPTSGFGGGLSARCIEQLWRGGYKSHVLTPTMRKTDITPCCSLGLKMVYSMDAPPLHSWA